MRMYSDAPLCRFQTTERHHAGILMYHLMVGAPILFNKELCSVHTYAKTCFFMLACAHAIVNGGPHYKRLSNMVVIVDFIESILPLLCRRLGGVV